MHIPYLKLFKHLPDFEVAYHIFPLEEGGRCMAAFQGIRWDFMYDEYPNEGFMIYPEILDVKTDDVFESGMSIPEHGKATMWILNPQLRSMHQKRIQVGTRGYFIEGPKKVAVCEVTQIIGLFSNPIA